MSGNARKDPRHYAIHCLTNHATALTLQRYRMAVFFLLRSIKSNSKARKTKHRFERSATAYTALHGSEGHERTNERNGRKWWPPKIITIAQTTQKFKETLERAGEREIKKESEKHETFLFLFFLFFVNPGVLFAHSRPVSRESKIGAKNLSEAKKERIFENKRGTAAR